MSVEREGKRAALFPFALPPMVFHGAGWKGGAGFGGSLPSAAAALSVYGCQRVGRVSVLNVFLRLRLSIFPDQGVVFSGDLYSRRQWF